MGKTPHTCRSVPRNRYKPPFADCGYQNQPPGLHAGALAVRLTKRGRYRETRSPVRTGAARRAPSRSGSAMAQIGLRVRFRSQAPPFWHRSAFVSDSARGLGQALSSHRRSTCGNARQLFSAWFLRACGIGHEGRSVPKNTPSLAESDTKADLCHPGSATTLAGSAEWPTWPPFAPTPSLQRVVLPPITCETLSGWVVTAQTETIFGKTVCFCVKSGLMYGFCPPSQLAWEEVSA